MYTKPYITDLTTCQDKNACSHQIVEPLKWSLEYFYSFFSGRACLLLFACFFLSFYRCVFNYYSSLSRCCCCSIVDVVLLMYFC